MKLGTHEERLAALEKAYESAATAMDRAQIVEIAARMSADEEALRREEFLKFGAQQVSDQQPQ